MNTGGLVREPNSGGFQPLRAKSFHCHSLRSRLEPCNLHSSFSLTREWGDRHLHTLGVGNLFENRHLASYVCRVWLQRYIEVEFGKWGVQRMRSRRLRYLQTGFLRSSSICAIKLVHPLPHRWLIALRWPDTRSWLGLGVPSDEATSENENREPDWKASFHLTSSVLWDT